MAGKLPQSTLYARIETEIHNYLSGSFEVSPGVKFSQYKLINRIYKFRNRDLTGGTKVNSDLSYDYWFDIISPRVDNEVKNLRFDTKHILVFSQNPRKDFAAVFLSNASLKQWMAENGEDDKLKAAVEEYSENGNVGFKRIKGGYELVDPLNTIITNQLAQTIDDTDIVERHEMTASQLKRMEGWDQDVADKVIKDLGNKTFKSAELTTPSESTGKRYEIYEFTGEVSEAEYNYITGQAGGDEHTYFLAKVIVAGLRENKTGEKYTLFADKLSGKLSDHYIYAHRGRYNGRFWRVGIYEMLFDYQIRANEIGNQLARGLEWASKVIFRSKDPKVLQNIRADIDNGDIIITEDLSQVEVRLQGVDQLIADWNRLISDADRLTNSMEVVRGEMPAGAPFRMGLLLDENAGKLFTLLRQKITLPYQRVFREWVLPELVKDMKAKDIFRLVGDTELLDQFREIVAESWYAQNLVTIGPHTKETAAAIKAEKIEELRKTDPAIKNSREIWEGVMPRLLVTITGENSDMADQMQNLMTMVQLEQDPERRKWMLNTMYRSMGIPIPPEAPPRQQMLPGQDGMIQEAQVQPEQPTEQEGQQPALP